jgi:hypothetical protein
MSMSAQPFGYLHDHKVDGYNHQCFCWWFDEQEDL